MQPDPKARSQLELVQAAIGPQERLLHHVFCILFVAGHAVSQSEEGMTVALDKHAKGLFVALAHASHHGGITVFHHNA